MTASQVCRAGLSAALLAASAMVTVPLGPVPLTLQTLVLALLVVALDGRDAVRDVGLYLLLGTLGMPVFSGFAGGVGHLLGPTGGFLWGFFLGTACAAALRRIPVLPEPARDFAGALVMLAVSYAAGVAQLCWASGISPAAALVAGVLPFVGPDLLKLLVGVSAGRAVKRALGAPAADRP